MTLCFCACLQNFRIENYGFDGIGSSWKICDTPRLLTSTPDIDFEFPSAAQKAAFTSLITELRTALDQHAASKGESGNPYLLSVRCASCLQP